MKATLLAAAALLAATSGVPVGARCIQAYRIQSTEIESDSAILFHMIDGTTYRNVLPARCPGLKSATNGFTYEPTNPATDELCDNLADFRINETGGGAVCLFGAFTPLPRSR